MKRSVRFADEMPHVQEDEAESGAETEKEQHEVVTQRTSQQVSNSVGQAPSHSAIDANAESSKSSAKKRTFDETPAGSLTAEQQKSMSTATEGHLDARKRMKSSKSHQQCVVLNSTHFHLCAA